MPRKSGASSRYEVNRKRRKKSAVEGNKKKSRRAKLKHRRVDHGLME